tara:strand:- start:1189 stop:1485 length:297 start_codon:yes stop_codon:yes gene_type:complete
MAEKKDGITDLTKVLVCAAKNFNEKEYSKLQSVIFAMLHGVSYGYTSMDARFLEDSNDLFFIHRADKIHKKIIKKKVKYKDNVIQFKDFSTEDVTNDG